MKRFAIFGASGFGREILPIVRSSLLSANECDLVFVDDNLHGSNLNGLPVLSYAQWLALPASERFITIAIADGRIREKLTRKCDADDVAFFDVKSDNVIVMDDVEIGAGSILCPSVTLTSNIRIGKQFHANLYSYVAHDCVIGDFVTFAPGVHCNGNVLIEDHAYIGTGAILRQGKPGTPLIIGRGATVGMGAVVTKDVAPGSTVIGNPARQMTRDR